MTPIEALVSGFQHSYGQIKDDIGSLMEGSYNPGTVSRVMDIAKELPLGKMIAAVKSAPTAMGAKVFKEAPEMSLEQLIRKIGKGEASMPAYTVLQPAYRHKATGELLTGSIGGGHASITQAVPQDWIKNLEHGYKYPGGPFIADEWQIALRDPKIAQTAANLLQKGIKPDSIFEALKFANPSTR
jgi:hypothetical protein